MRNQYQQARADYTSLRARTTIGDGRDKKPSSLLRISELRQRADADRPYLIAVQDVIAE